jgi:hypothetical protein
MGITFKSVYKVKHILCWYLLKIEDYEGDSGK